MDVTVIAHRPGGRYRDRDAEPDLRTALIRAAVTVVLVTAVVAAALGGVTYLASKAFVAMLS